MAGGGQFHHLRTAADIADTFVGELGDLLAVAARQVLLEVELPTGIESEVISEYWAGREGDRVRIVVGDLLAGEERWIIFKLRFPAGTQSACRTVRARVTWRTDATECYSDWIELSFAYANAEACRAEVADSEVLHWSGLHLAERAKRDALKLNQKGDLDGSRRVLRALQEQLAPLGDADSALDAAVRELADLECELSKATVDTLTAKEMRFQSHRSSRGQRDHRRGPGTAASLRPVYLVGHYLSGGLAWPNPLRAPNAAASDEARDLYRGCLLWGAVGDALGRPAEGVSPAALLARYGPNGLCDYVPWHGWQGGPRGTITDDTQLVIEVAKSLLATGDELDCDDLVRRLLAWLPSARGIGRATQEVLSAVAIGEPWLSAASRVNSAGNGAAMRAAPVGLARAFGLSADALRRDAVLAALPTHTHQVGVAGSVVVAAGVAWCLRRRLDGQVTLDAREFAEFVGASIAGIETQPTTERRPGGAAVFLRERIAELPFLAQLAPEEAFARTWNGAFALESVPAALYCFLHSGGDPKVAILTAVNAGHDADTVASMAGNLVGAWCGAERLRRDEPMWWSGLEYRDELIDLADRLHDLAVRTVR